MASLLRRSRGGVVFANCMACSQRLLHGGLPRTNNTDLSVPVLIVGAGPVGMILSILLAKLGVQSLTVDKNLHFSQHPQAHFINNRTMEIFRRIGTLSEDIEALQPPIKQWSKFIYCSSLTGPLLGVVEHLHTNDLLKKLSPTWVAHFSQHRLVQLLHREAERHGIHVTKDSISGPRLTGLGEVKLGHECISIEETLEGVKATIITGRGDEDVLRVDCKFLVGADGAMSKIRRLIDVQMDGEDALQDLISIHFFSIDLAQYLAQNRPGMLYFIFNAKAVGVLVAHDLRSGEFVLQVPFYPPQQRVEDFTDDACKDILCTLAGDNLGDIDIKTIKHWVMRAQVASSYLSKYQRIILAGDAAHRFPPAGGFGMNTGIQDAHNLAWKLASVLNGVSTHSLLSTYEIERQPIAKANTALSVENYKAAMSVPSALGLNPLTARLVHRQINEGIGSILPYKLQRGLLESVFALGQAQLSPLILNQYNPLGSLRLQKLNTILQDGKSLQLQFPAEDLGFRYKDGAIVNTKEMSKETAECKIPGRKNAYNPVCKPGDRLPHARIAVLNEKFQKTKVIISTLDLIKGNALEFLALVGPNDHGRLWGNAMAAVAKELGVNFKVVVLWPNCNFSEKESVIHEWDIADPVLHVEGIDGNWWETYGIPVFGAILVRPDDHVAWVSAQKSNANSQDELYHVFRTILRKEEETEKNLYYSCS